MSHTDSPNATPRFVSLARIWDRSPHNAFTDLLRHDAKWWCTFFEADNHGSSIGTVRIIVADDGESWTSSAELTEADIDLRDPKLSVTPDGRMVLLTCGCTHCEATTRSPWMAFSDDGRNWSTPARVLAEDHWLWRVTWHGKVGYSVPKLGEGRNLRRGFLYRTTKGIDWQWITEFIIPGNIWTVSETTLRIMPDEQMIALIHPNLIEFSGPPNRRIVGLATITVDRFASITAGFMEGQLVRKPMTWQGGDLLLNASTTRHFDSYPLDGGGAMQIEAWDESGQPIEGFSGESAAPFDGNVPTRGSVDPAVVRWPGDRRLDELAGKRIRLMFLMRDAHLFSFRSS